jgi:hypothetical protein
MEMSWLSPPGVSHSANTRSSALNKGYMGYYRMAMVGRAFIVLALLMEVLIMGALLLPEFLLGAKVGGKNNH